MTDHACQCRLEACNEGMRRVWCSYCRPAPPAPPVAESPEVASAAERCDWILLPNASSDWEHAATAIVEDLATLARAYLRSTRAGVVGVPVTVKDRKPRPHQKYAVIRGDDIFTAIPCYGMHNPWWVGRTLTDNVIGNSETEPCGMRDGDSYLPIADLTARLLPAPVAKEG